MRFLRLYLKSFNNNIINLIIKKIKILSIKLKFIYKGPIILPNKKERFNILRSPHVNKNSRDQLEIRWYKKFIDIYKFKPIDIFHIKNIFVFYNLDFILYYVR